MFAVPSFFGYNTTFVSTPVATAATGVGETSFTANWNAFVGASYYLLDVSTSSSFSSFVGSYQNFVVLSTSQLVSGLTASTTYYYRLRAATGVDADAAAFFGRVYAAGGALSYTEVSATETLVADLKANSLWTPMKAIYPMVGASAAACAQNLKSSSFTGTFTATGWTFASTGVTPNGTSAYMDTNFVPNTSLTLNSCSFSVYSRNNFTPTTAQSLGCSDGGTNIPIIGNTFDITKYVEGLSYSYNPPDVIKSATGQNFAAMFLTTRTSSASAKLFRNTTQLAAVTTQGQTTQPISKFTLGAFRTASTFINYNNFQFAFAHIGDGLTDTQASNFYTAVQAMQTTLSRQV